MIRKDKGLRRICAHYEQVENYAKAVADEENKWELHHRNEITEMKSAQQLIDEGRYYNVSPEELIFITASEHMRLHNAYKKTFYGRTHSEETKQKISEALKGENNPMFGKSGEKNGMFGKQHSEESKKKMSEAHKGNKACLGLHWWNDGIVEIKSKERPDGFVKGRLRKNS